MEGKSSIQKEEPFQKLLNYCFGGAMFFAHTHTLENTHFRNTPIRSYLSGSGDVPMSQSGRSQYQLIDLQPFPTNKATIDAKDFEWEQNEQEESMWSEFWGAHPEIQKEILTNT